MLKEDISLTIKKQSEFFKTGQSMDVDFRIASLKKIRKLIIDYLDRLYDALWKDLHKPEFESHAGEVGIALQEIDVQLRGVRKWSRPKRVHTPLLHFYSRSYIYTEPMGKVLIFSPWNFPFQLSFVPLIGAVAAGNCVVLKPSQHTPHTSSVMEEMIRRNFDPGYIAFFPGGKNINQALLDEKFDYIFFTGSQKVGRIVMETASRNLTPVSLELGGKNPCIVDNTASINFAAKRITWGKFFNAGQSCVAPDYLLVHKEIKEKLLQGITGNIYRFYGQDPQSSPDYPRIGNVATAERLAHLIQNGKVVTGGKTDISERYVAPTILDEVRPDEAIMEEEIFGPVLPVITYSDMEEAIQLINTKPQPLACYIFTNKPGIQKNLLRRISFGTASVNDTVVQFINPNLPFGGVGESGIGRYHGRKSFDTFTNFKSVMKKTNLFDISLRYPPYSG
ncbi:MAG: aldehyde dehydrogenase, partial [Bacteroidales bacterium]